MKDLTPYLKYFTLLRSYVRQGYLEVFPATGEAYITLPALYTLAGTDVVDGKIERIRKIGATVHHLRTYTQYLNAHQEGFKQYEHEQEQAKDTPANSTNVEQAYNASKKWPQNNYQLAKPFALHVVDSQYPHDLRFTVLLTHRRRWFWPFTYTDKFDVIEYG